MSSYDLNAPGGLQAITGPIAGASTLLTSLTGALSSNWVIQEGAYGHPGPNNQGGTNVLFHVFKTATNFNAALSDVQDTAGHRKVPIVFPYMDGQSTDDLGRKGEIFDINVLIFGPNYKAQYIALLAELNNPVPGVLTHPVRGKITVAAEDWITTHSNDKKQAVTMRLRFIEHSFTVSYADASTASSVPGALTKAIGFVGTLSSYITQVQSLEFVAANTINLVSSLITGYISNFQTTLQQLNYAFNPNTSSVIPGLLPTVAGSDPTLFNTVSSPNNAFTGTQPTSSTQSQGSQQLTAALASQQAIDAVTALLNSLESQIVQIQATESGQGALIFYDTILALQQSAQAIISVLNFGLATSSSKVINYTTPYTMDVREVCFANGLSPDDSYDIEVLNPSLLSLNYIPAGTIVQVPT